MAHTNVQQPLRNSRNLYLLDKCSHEALRVAMEETVSEEECQSVYYALVVMVWHSLLRKSKKLMIFLQGNFGQLWGQENWGQRSVFLGRGANPDPKLPLAACGLISLFASRPGTSGNF